MITLILSGCRFVRIEQEKIRDVPYTVVSQDEWPKELTKLIEEKRKEPFQMTFQDGDDLYLCRGYGQQQRGGMSIQVKELYEVKNGICFSSVLTGELVKEQSDTLPSFPVIVVKIEYENKVVVFD